MTAETCDHPDFRADVTVNRLTDSGAFIADVQIACAVCGLPFEFIGLDAGLAFDAPRVSVTALELHAPIRPRGGTHLAALPGYRVRRI